VKFSGAGDYAITVTLGSNPNYTVSKTDGNLHINPKTASVTADDKTKTYGDDTPALTATVTGTVNGDTLNYSLATIAVKFSSAGDYAITVTLGSNPNYTVSKTDGNLHINPKAASVAADNKSKTYGDDNPALTATVTGTVNGDMLSYTLATTAVKFSGVGDYAITATLGSNPNYTVTKTDGNLHINPKAASVSADNKTKTYGDDNPALTATVTGTVNGDMLNYTLATTAVKFSNVGDYTITVTLLSNPNYTVSKTDGNLHINPKAATVTADNKSKTYGAANPTLTATVTGTVNGDMLNYTLVTTAVLCSNVGPYTITVTLGSNPNYNVTPTNGTLTITKKHLTVTADNKSKAYDGNPFTAFTVMITGFTCGDGVAVVSGSVTYTGTAVGATLPGTYTITPQVGTLTATNYDFTPFVDGTLTIGYGTCTGSDPGGVILQPINADGSSVFPRSGRTVPVKFKVCDANGNPISDPTVVFAGTGGQLTMLSAVRGQIPNPDESQYNDIPDVAFRYAGGFWIFNMATSNLNAQTTYTFRINLKYGSITFVIAIK
jgi:energy-converting hydrogenase Eha subunit H